MKNEKNQIMPESIFISQSVKEFDIKNLISRAKANRKEIEIRKKMKKKCKFYLAYSKQPNQMKRPITFAGIGNPDLLWFGSVAFFGAIISIKLGLHSKNISTRNLHVGQNFKKLDTGLNELLSLSPQFCEYGI